ncbi:zinc ribbon domain-containing protein [Micromonospora sp. M12]
MTLVFDQGRLWVEVTAELPVATYPAGQEPERGGSPGSTWASFTRTRWQPVTGRCCWCPAGRSAPSTVSTWPTQRPPPGDRGPCAEEGQRGSRRWRKTRRRARLMEGRHRRRVRQAGHEAAKTVIGWAVQHRVGTLTVGDPRGVLDLPAGRRHNLRLRQWQLGRAIAVLKDKAELAGITVYLVDERGTSSTCPVCRRRVVKPAGGP